MPALQGGRSSASSATPTQASGVLCAERGGAVSAGTAWAMLAVVHLVRCIARRQGEHYENKSNRHHDAPDCWCACSSTSCMSTTWSTLQPTCVMAHLEVSKVSGAQYAEASSVPARAIDGSHCSHCSSSNSTSSSTLSTQGKSGRHQLAYPLHSRCRCCSGAPLGDCVACCDLVAFGNPAHAGYDYICVQSYDGQLSVFECESFAFARYLPGFLIPGVTDRIT
jgi:hypothetical protein